MGRAVFRAPIVLVHELRTAALSFKGTLPFLSTEDVGYQYYQRLLKSDDPLSVSIGLDNGPPGILSPFENRDEDGHYYPKGPDGSWWEGAANTSSYVITLPTKLVLAPVIDGLGAPSWDMMNRRTELLRRRPGQFEGVPEELQDWEQGSLSSGRTGAVAKFIEKLIEIKKEEKRNIEITLIGHSMGTIVANWIVADYGAESQPRNIVYLASAASMKDFERQVVPYLASDKGKRTEFYNLTLHPRAEVREQNYFENVIAFAPRGSLLVWIDNYLSNPETFLDRTLGRWDNVIVATQIFPKSIRDRVHIKAFGICPRGKKNPELNPERHAEFTHGAFWREDFWHPETGREGNKCAADNNRREEERKRHIHKRQR